MDQKPDDFTIGYEAGKAYGIGLGAFCGVIGVGIIAWLIALVRSLLS